MIPFFFWLFRSLLTVFLRCFLPPAPFVTVADIEALSRAEIALALREEGVTGADLEVCALG